MRADCLSRDHGYVTTDDEMLSLSDHRRRMAQFQSFEADIGGLTNRTCQKQTHFCYLTQCKVQGKEAAVTGFLIDGGWMFICLLCRIGMA